jgi:hypothetical protein
MDKSCTLRSVDVSGQRTPIGGTESIPLVALGAAPHGQAVLSRSHPARRGDVSVRSTMTLMAVIAGFI